MDTFRDRVRMARRASEFAGVIRRDKNGQPVTVVVPGHEGKQYQVSFSRARSADGVLRASCFLTGNNQVIGDCPGNVVGVCYHVMAAMIAVAAKTGCSVRMYEHVDSDTPLFGNRRHTLVSGQSQARLVFSTVAK